MVCKDKFTMNEKKEDKHNEKEDEMMKMIGDETVNECVS